MNVLKMCDGPKLAQITADLLQNQQCRNEACESTRGGSRQRKRSTRTEIAAYKGTFSTAIICWPAPFMTTQRFGVAFVWCATFKPGFESFYERGWLLCPKAQLQRSAWHVTISISVLCHVVVSPSLWPSIQGGHRSARCAAIRNNRS